MFKKVLCAVFCMMMLVSIAAPSMAASNGWYCPKCGKWNPEDYNFCPNDRTQKPTGTSGTNTKSAGSIRTGSYVTFGTYEQDNNTSNGKEKIEWRVLAVQDDKVFLVSRYGLDVHLFHNTDADVTWSNCDMRRWLNGSFLSSAFSSSEQSAIQTTNVYNDASTGYAFGSGKDINPKYGPDTSDKLFLLSWQETQWYLKGTSDMKCKATDYAAAQGAKVMRNGYCWWWLRSPGYTWHMALGVNSEGKRVPGDQRVNNGGENTGLVRPALWVNASAVSR